MKTITNIFIAGTIITLIASIISFFYAFFKAPLFPYILYVLIPVSVGICMMTIAIVLKIKNKY